MTSILFDNSRFLSPELVSAGLKQGTLFVGKLRINKRNRHDGYVTIEQSARDIFIPGMVLQNRALEGDTVVVEMMSGTQLQIEVARVGKKRTENIQSGKDRQKTVELKSSGNPEEEGF